MSEVVLVSYERWYVQQVLDGLAVHIGAHRAVNLLYAGLMDLLWYEANLYGLDVVEAFTECYRRT